MKIFGKCNSDKCHCPRCEDSRRITRLESTVAELDRRLRERVIEPRVPKTFYERIQFELRERNRGLTGEHKIYHSEGCYWKWHRTILGWRKRDIRKRAMFGPAYRHIEFTRDGFRTSSRAIVMDHGDVFGRRHSATEHTTVKRVGDMEHTETKRYEFDDAPNPALRGLMQHTPPWEARITPRCPFCSSERTHGPE